LNSAKSALRVDALAHASGDVRKPCARLPATRRRIRSAHRPAIDFVSILVPGAATRKRHNQQLPSRAIRNAPLQILYADRSPPESL